MVSNGDEDTDRQKRINSQIRSLVSLWFELQAAILWDTL